MLGKSEGEAERDVEGRRDITRVGDVDGMANGNKIGCEDDIEDGNEDGSLLGIDKGSDDGCKKDGVGDGIDTGVMLDDTVGMGESSRLGLADVAFVGIDCHI